MASSYTTNYNLDKYVGTDKPNLRDQYNAAMDKIDNALLAANTNATEAKAATLSFQGDLDDLQDQIGSGFSSSSTVADAITSEESARQNADTALSNSISSEQTARQNADTALSNSISSEQTARQNADTTLQANIDALSAIIPASSFSANNTVKDYVDSKNTKKRVVVVFGDSWTDENVPASKWVTALRSLPNYEFHNYATNGCHMNNGSFTSMYTAFLNDTSFDKNTITDCLLLYGVNDQSTYPIASATFASNFVTFYNAIMEQMPDDVILKWVTNHTYGFYNNSPFKQVSYWNNVLGGIGNNCPKMTITHSISWFNESEYNDSNYFHLKETAQRRHLAKNMFAIMNGAPLLKYLTLETVWSTSEDYYGLRANIGDDGVVNISYDVRNFSDVTTINLGHVMPVRIPYANGIGINTDGSIYLTRLVSTAPSGSVLLTTNQILFAASSASKQSKTTISMSICSTKDD